MLSDQQFAELMAKTRSGDQDAARELVRQYEPEIRRAARLRLTDPRLRRIVDSIDICQSVFGRFFKSATDGSFDLEKPEQLLVLLTTMTRNRIIDEHRRQTTQKRNRPEPDGRPFDPCSVIEDSPGPRTAAAARELLSEVRSRLTADELQIADLRNAGKSWEEVATELSESADGLRKRLERALDRVRAEIEASPIG
ncbi:RNA polymerase sigma factor [Fuerstiella marisgermanici]|uniref:RNA polymerase sigma factor n=1 Tax=Fuerstiella marisgermanici TaxID=1891926 RepID=A0A1P8WLU8_9PLAN|nr:sigma-70 family RNA polymerase sigma factor [Fuerstiella marisgermanici]APZ95019.1 RNA polymerase sigma factor [Fuerstiella marisgermanici]